MPPCAAGATDTILFPERRKFFHMIVEMTVNKSRNAEVSTRNLHIFPLCTALGARDERILWGVRTRVCKLTRCRAGALCGGARVAKYCQPRCVEAGALPFHPNEPERVGHPVQDGELG